jgi:hypothetical protein
LKLDKAEASLNVGGEILGESEQRTTVKKLLQKLCMMHRLI